MELRQLRYFMRVAETLHFGLAAQREYVAQSVISTQIASLEQDLGFRLFERTSRKVTLTPAGEAFVVDARRMLEQLERAVEQARAVANRQHTPFRIGIFGEGAGPMTHPILSAFAAARPDLGLACVELSMVDGVESVLDGTVDVAFLRLPVTDDRVRVDPLFSEPRLAAVPVHHELADAESLAVEDLIDEPFAVATRRAPSDWRSYWSLDDVRGEACRVGGEVRSIAESLATIAYRNAVDTFPATAARMFEHPGVRYLPLPDAEPSTLSLVSLQAGEPDDAVEQFHRVAAAVTDEQLHLIPDAVRAR